MRVTASKLRENIYQILDQVILNGKPVEVVRKGSVLRIVPEIKESKAKRWTKRDAFIGDPDDIVHMDWSKEWTELK